MNNIFWKWGLIFAGLSVALGAFAAHGLKSIFPVESLSIFETGVRYQFYHAFAILFAALLVDRNPQNSLLIWAGRSFVAGIFLFSGSLYLLAAIKADKLHFSEAVGLITPIGGLLFIAGWVLLLLASFKR
jgi:uncharacterized membrane protein YgdD (TMEM256/DUF423 family)